MPNRILKETICTSETIEALSLEAEAFFYRLLVRCDDFGRMDGRASVLRAACYPLRLDRISDTQISEWLIELEVAGLVWTYRVEGRPYLQVTKWDKHQQRRAKVSKFPDPPASDIACNQLQADAGNSPRGVEESRDEESGNRDDAPAPAGEPPTGAPAPARPAAPARDELLIGSSESGLLLQGELERYYQSKNRASPRHFQSQQQRTQYETVFRDLGDELAALTEKGLARERSSLPKLLAWLQTCAKNNRRAGSGLDWTGSHYGSQKTGRAGSSPGGPEIGRRPLTFKVPKAN